MVAVAVVVKMVDRWRSRLRSFEREKRSSPMRMRIMVSVGVL